MSNTKLMTREEAVEAGYDGFNSGPHLAVDVPDGHYTITARLPDGRKITFAFVDYGKGKAGCVDVSTGDVVLKPIVFHGGGTGYHHFDHEGEATLATFVIEDPEERKD